MKNKIDFMLAGVGGQGTILASDILVEVGLKLGYDAKKSEVHGMSQRGGTVESHVRWGEKVYSPVVERGKLDYLIGFEMLEAARWTSYMNNQSAAIVNRYRVPPPSVNLGLASYPPDEELQHFIETRAEQFQWVEGNAIAQELGNPAVAGVVLLGVLASKLGGSEDVWLEVIEQLVPPKFIDLNKQAFIRGKRLNA
ncbi:indolepyruvate oxidoreductase subunit beta [Desulfoscipio gibsoniae]|uniref:2-oxoacid:ferredoxin oxidoreductase, gamma subunit n=1 Tax=Desulfoscipio gibsoniae DSM 7213 TaxID=767817 RepID=R4KCK6_9FIRM|nr:indolepyruvate oxidoreductase subunit beta [Desulfoscipio gibsoniae]AGL00913.1 2-oxoacid:ferredoxin oxidoreductase, gamma subunit [Desulfoscipio gibsoniae DSM 7213]